MRRSLILELLEHMLVCGSSLMVSALFAPYGEGLGRSWRELERQADRCTHDFSSHSRSTVSVTLNKLKKRGLVVTQGSKKKAIWLITLKGKRHFQKMITADSLPPEDGKVRLVIFDIPEEHRSQRAWLRSELVRCGYTYLQKSVWIGTRPLPERSRDEFKMKRIIEYIRVVGLEDSQEMEEV